MAEAKKRRFDVVLVWAFGRIARSVRHFLEVLDEFNHLSIDFISFRATNCTRSTEPTSATSTDKIPLPPKNDHHLNDSMNLWRGRVLLSLIRDGQFKMTIDSTTIKANMA
jgi:hypothetical protein